MKNIKKSIFIFIISIILIIGLFFGYKVISFYIYKNAIKKNNCSTIYNYSLKVDSYYTSKDKYIELCNNLDKSNISTKISYFNKYDDVVKIISDVKITIPSDSSLFLDGILVKDGFKLDEYKIYKTYSFKQLYAGIYNIKIKNNTNEIIDSIDVSNINKVFNFEYDNDKINITLVSSSYCSHCINLKKFLDTLDKNIFILNDYDVFDNAFASSVIKKIENNFNMEVIGYPTFVIGDKVFAGFNEDSSDEYVQKIYETYRNGIKNIFE